MKTSPFAFKVCGSCLVVLGLVACSPADESNTSNGGSGGQPSSAAGASGAGAVNGMGASGGQTSIAPRQCKPSAPTPLLTISGTSCGRSVQYAAPEGTRVHISHAPFAPFESVNAISIADTDNFTYSSSPGFLSDHDLSFYVNTEETTDFAVGSRTFTLYGGRMDACGVGTIYFKPGTSVTIAFESITPGPDVHFGQLRLRISGLAVDGASGEFGATQVTQCNSGGELTVTFDGEYERVR